MFGYKRLLKELVEAGEKIEVVDDRDNIYAQHSYRRFIDALGAARKKLGTDTFGGFKS